MKNWASTSKMPSAAEASAACAKYIEDGFEIVHWEPTPRDIVEGKGKGPAIHGWQRIDYSAPSPSANLTNVGLKCGTKFTRGPNQGLYLVCVDVDDPGLQKLADLKLPATALCGGKEATPRSHLFFVTDKPMNCFTWSGERSDGTYGAILEILGVSAQGTVGHQAMVAPSVHLKSGTRCVWDSYGPPTETTCESLYEACRQLCEGVAGKLTVGQNDPPAWEHTTPKFTEHADRAATVPIDEDYKPSDAVTAGADLDEAAIRRLVNDCAARCATLEAGSRRNGLNRLVFVTASVLQGGKAPESAFDNLRNAVVELADKLPPPDVNARIWITATDAAIRDGRANPRRRAGLRKYPLTVQGLTDLLVDEWRDHYRYVYLWKRWIRWNGLIWERVPETSHLLRDIVHILRWAQSEAMRAPDNKWRDSAFKWYYQCESGEAPTKAEKLLRAMESSGMGLGINPQGLNTDKWLFACSNGYYDIRTGLLREPTRGDYVTQISPCNYLPAIPDDRFEDFAPRFMHHINWIFEPQGPEDAKLATAYLASWLGYAVTGSNQEQKMLIMYGAGNNGKSALLDVVHAVSGDYSTKLAKEVLIRAKSEGKNSDEVAELEGRRWGYFSETEANEFLSEARIKMLTGSSTVRAMRKFQDAFYFDLQCKLLLDTNHKPRIHGKDGATLRRLKLLPFTNKVTAAMRVMDWHALVVRDEGHAVLTWLLRQAHTYFVNQGLTPEPACVAAAVEDFTVENDPIGLFLDEMCETLPAEDPGKAKLVAASGPLYAAYNKWSKDNGRFPLGAGAWTKDLLTRGFDRRRTSKGYCWAGLRLKPWDDPQAIETEALESAVDDEKAATLEARLGARRGRAEPIEPGMPGYVEPGMPGYVAPDTPG